MTMDYPHDWLGTLNVLPSQVWIFSDVCGGVDHARWTLRFSTYLICRSFQQCSMFILSNTLLSAKVRTALHTQHKVGVTFQLVACKMTCARETDHEFVADNAGVG